MSSKDDIDIHAYVDGELTAEERLEVLAVLRKDPDVAREVCELNNLKSQLELAYAHPPGLGERATVRRRSTWLTLAASVLTLAIGVTGGWLAGHNDTVADRLVLLDPAGRGQAPATAESEETRIVFHITTPDQLVAGELLDDVESMLQAYQREGRNLRVEIVSNGEGLDFLRQGLSQYQARIHQLAESYRNLTFVACKNTIDRLQVEQGIEINVLPDAEVIESGVSHVVERQKEGWAYIRV